ncbi:hypothetical protein Hrd1104_09985 [Halorhabdus sp. CBA1104]|uniref:hypothetical protein n=1 Tax=Halorhabdus sp. CBA1104 TaxID=1380432 RepID=UPI0012B2155A|nr:hypothetical protein [Halorhabdus sp. CBA1104]QGN07597.1 hypothetical protein Hrd1104_09985 [Halorhabdus sp. CBA1104]
MSTNTKSSNDSDEQFANHIPEPLESRDQWVCWSTDENGQRYPANPKTDNRVDPSDPDTFVGYEAAEMFSDALSAEMDGLGFALTEDDPLVGIRLENAVSDGEPEEWAEDIIDTVDSYAEYGPEQTHILLLVQGPLPDGGERSSDVEMTDRERVYPVTGDRLEQAPSSIEERETALKELHKEYIADEHTDGDSGDTAGLESGSPLSDVRETVLEEFDQQTWEVTEASLCVPASLLLEGLQSCTGLVIVGETGAGKSTVIRFFNNGLDDLVERSDDATPASFVSAEPSKDEEELEKMDLLPRIRHKLMTCKDMSGWFAGDQASIKKWMSVVANVMDGDGYVRDTGSHGQRGYTGDYRFGFLGATTPLPQRAWNVMGHTGNRLVFHEKSKMTDMSQAVSDVFDDDEYGKKVARCQEAVQTLLNDLWSEHGGYGSVEWESSLSDELQQVFEYLTMLVVHARAPVKDGTTKKEGPHRIVTTLRDIARGRALLCGRKQVEIEDAQVCARIALSTMPKERRPVVRAVLNPKNDGSLSTSDLTEQTPYTEPTVLKRMELLETLGIAECKEVDDRGTKVIEQREKFEWPDLLDFPDF